MPSGAETVSERLYSLRDGYLDDVGTDGGTAAGFAAIVDADVKADPEFYKRQFASLIGAKRGRVWESSPDHGAQMSLFDIVGYTILTIEDELKPGEYRKLWARCAKIRHVKEAATLVLEKAAQASARGLQLMGRHRELLEMAGGNFELLVIEVDPPAAPKHPNGAPDDKPKHPN